MGHEFLRFSRAETFDRFTPLSNDGVLQYALELADERCSVKTTSSKTRYVTVDGTERMSS